MKHILKIMACVALTLLSNTVIWADDNKLVPYKNPKTGLYGYKTAENLLIKDKFIDAYEFCRDRAVVGVSKKGVKLYGIIGLDGKFIVKPMFKQFYALKSSNQDPVFTQDGLIEYSTGNNRYGIIDLNGNTLLADKYTNISYRNINDKVYLICQDESEHYGMFLKENDTSDLKETLKFSYRSIEFISQNLIKAIILTKSGPNYEIYKTSKFSMLGTFDSFKAVDGIFIGKSIANKYFLYNSRGEAIVSEASSIQTKYYTEISGDYLEVINRNGSLSLFLCRQGNLIPIIHGDNNYKSAAYGYGNDWIVSCSDGSNRIYNRKGISNPTHSQIKKEYKWKNASGGCYFLYDSKGEISILCSDGNGKYWSSWKNVWSVDEAKRLINGKGVLADSCYKRLLKTDLDNIKKNPDLIPKVSHLYSTRIYDSDGTIDIEKDTKIYTFAKAYSSKDITFYVFNPSASARETEMYSNSYTEFSGRMVSVAALKMNSIKIGDKTAFLKDVFTNYKTLMKGVKQFVPDSYFMTKDKNTVLLFYHVVYEDKPTIVYTEPAYVNIAGQLREVNSGINYIPSYYNQGYVSEIDMKSMQVKSTITLETFNTITAQLLDENRICCYDSKNTEILASEKSPLYVIDTNLNVDLQLNFLKGDLIYDLIEKDGLLYMCGSNTESRYVGYNNPLVIIYDLKEHKVLKRLNGSKQFPKGAYYQKIIGVGHNCIRLKVYGGGIDTNDVVYIDS